MVGVPKAYAIGIEECRPIRGYEQGCPSILQCWSNTTNWYHIRWLGEGAKAKTELRED